LTVQRSNEGFTLIEVLMAMSLLMISVMLIFHTVRVVRQIHARFSPEAVMLAENQLQHLLEEKNHPRGATALMGAWKVSAKSETRGGLIHFYVNVSRPSSQTSYSLYTARLESDYIGR
jgi:Tfp pilus assembly protein PilV